MISADALKGVEAFERYFAGVIPPAKMEDGDLKSFLQAVYWAANGLKYFPYPHPLQALRQVLSEYQDRLWKEYQGRFGQGEFWPASREDRPDNRILTPAGWRKEYNNRKALQNLPLRELKWNIENYNPDKLDGGHAYLDPILTLQSWALVPAQAEYWTLSKAELARRERLRKRKAA